MNKEDIIRMAREAQMPFYWRTGEITYLDKLERFAALVASAERSACANSMAKIVMIPTLTHGALVKLSDVVNAIRVRGSNAEKN